MKRLLSVLLAVDILGSTATYADSVTVNNTKWTVDSFGVGVTTIYQLTQSGATSSAGTCEYIDWFYGASPNAKGITLKMFTNDDGDLIYVTSVKGNDTGPNATSYCADTYLWACYYKDMDITIVITGTPNACNYYKSYGLYDKIRQQSDVYVAAAK